MLRRPSERKLVNVIDSNTIVDSGDNVIIAGFTIPKAVLDVISKAKKCLVYCAQDCVQKEVTVTVTLPKESCGCIEEWAVKIIEPIQGNYDLHDIRPKERVFVYDVPVGTTPTAFLIAADIVAQINATRGQNNYTVFDNMNGSFTITSKDGSCRNFDVFLPIGMGTVTVDQEFEPAVLSAEHMSKMFPIGPNSFAARPDLPLCGSYCKYVIKFSGWTQDLAHSLGQIAYKHDVELYVRNDVPEFQTLFANKLEQYMNCCACDFSFTLNTDERASIELDEDCVAESISWSINDPDASIATGQGTTDITFAGAEAGDEVTVTVTFAGCGPISKTVALIAS